MMNKKHLWLLGAGCARRWPMTLGAIIISPIFWFGEVENLINPMPRVEELRREKFMVLEVNNARPNLTLMREGVKYKADFPSDLAQKGARQHVVKSDSLKEITGCNVDTAYDHLKIIGGSDYRVWGLSCPGVLVVEYTRAAEYYSGLQLGLWAFVRMAAMILFIGFCWCFESRRKE